MATAINSSLAYASRGNHNSARAINDSLVGVEGNNSSACSVDGEELWYIGDDIIDHCP